MDSLFQPMSMRFFQLTVAFFLLSAGHESDAQSFAFRWNNAPTVVVNGRTLANPWAGGINSGQFSKMHLNDDSEEDLVVFDRAGGRLLTFLAVRQGSSYVWQHAPRYESLFPADLRSWLLLIDYDSDGRKDIFTNTSAGIRVFKNVANKNGFAWQLIADPLMTQGFSGNINLYVQSSDLPAIIDLDADGDLDIFAFDFSGNTVEYHQNFSVERGGKQPFVFRKVNTCWGGFTKEHCSDFKLNQDCGIGVGEGGRSGRVMHAGNSIWAGDLNGDGLVDILHGHVTCANVSVLYNGNSNTTGAVIKSFDKDFPASKPINFTVFPSVYVEDLDFDGRKDLIASPSVSGNEGNLVNLAQSNWFYKNEGTQKLPKFTYQQPDFLQNEMLELGENAAPALADYDGDGDLDLFVGFGGSRTERGYRASIWFFRNTGTRTKAAFELVNTDFLGISEKLVGEVKDRVLLTNVKPFFADVNSDGTLDFGYVANTFQGMELRYIPNAAPRGRAMQLSSAQLTKLPTPPNFVNGETALFYDIDTDGSTDLLISKGSGNVEFYRNAGAANAPTYELTNEFWGGFEIDFEVKSFVVADLNGDRKPELLMGGQGGSLAVFQEFTQKTGTLKANNNLMFNEFSDKVEAIRIASGLYPALGDLDGDQRPDLLVGTRSGGVLLLKNVSPAAAPVPSSEPDFLVYPNPAGNFVYVRVPDLGSLELFNNAGQLIQQATVGQLDSESVLITTDLPTGSYFVRFTNLQGSKATRKVAISH